MDKYEFIGSTEDGEKVYVAAEISEDEGTHDTVDHKTIENPRRISFQGIVLRKRGSLEREGTWESSGQVRPWLNAISHPAPGWTLGEIERLHLYWREWHLNTMQAGCEHQPPAERVYVELHGRREVDLDTTPVCPHTGYKYGSAWLTKPVTYIVQDWVLFKFPNSADALKKG